MLRIVGFVTRKNSFKSRISDGRKKGMPTYEELYDELYDEFEEKKSGGSGYRKKKSGKSVHAKGKPKSKGERREYYKHRKQTKLKREFLKSPYAKRRQVRIMQRKSTRPGVRRVASRTHRLTMKKGKSPQGQAQRHRRMAYGQTAAPGKKKKSKKESFDTASLLDLVREARFEGLNYQDFVATTISECSTVEEAENILNTVYAEMVEDPLFPLSTVLADKLSAHSATKKNFYDVDIAEDGTLLLYFCQLEKTGVDPMKETLSGLGDLDLIVAENEEIEKGLKSDFTVFTFKPSKEAFVKLNKAFDEDVVQDIEPELAEALTAS